MVVERMSLHGYETIESLLATSWGLLTLYVELTLLKLDLVFEQVSNSTNHVIGC